MATKPKRATTSKAKRPTGNLLGEFLLYDRLEDLRTQPDMAKALGISKSHLNDIEKGRKTVSVERAARFAKALGWEPKRLVGLALQDQVTAAGLDLTVDVKPR